MLTRGLRQPGALGKTCVLAEWESELPERQKNKTWKIPGGRTAKADRAETLLQSESGEVTPVTITKLVAKVCLLPMVSAAFDLSPGCCHLPSPTALLPTGPSMGCM